jgi:hypothetical protein
MVSKIRRITADPTGRASDHPSAFDTLGANPSARVSKQGGVRRELGNTLMSGALASPTLGKRQVKTTSV